MIFSIIWYSLVIFLCITLFDIITISMFLIVKNILQNKSENGENNNVH